MIFLLYFFCFKYTYFIKLIKNYYIFAFYIFTFLQNISNIYFVYIIFNQDMEKILQKITSIPGTLLNLLTKAFNAAYDAILAPPRYFWGVSGLILSLGSLGLYLSRRWQTANPNQWLLVIKDGKLKVSGIGLSSFVLPNQTVVKFPSLVEKADFNAQNVTKQMQGVQIQGYAFWSVYRNEEGPFKCYKYMEGGNANSNVRTMCQSIIRNTLANSTLQSVLRDRNVLKNAITNQLKPQLKGWGIWLETVELTEVKILSRTLFEDLQAEFRQETHLNAEEKRLVTSQKLKERQYESQIKVQRNQQQNQTRNYANLHTQQLLRKEQETKFLQENNKLRIQKIRSENQIELDRLQNTFEEEKQRTLNELERISKRKDIQLDNLKKQIENDKLYNELSLKKYSIDANQKAYRKFRNIRELKVNKFLDGENPIAFSQLLPGLNK